MAEARTLDPSVLREYDIRGVAGETLTEADAAAIGRAFGTVVRRRKGSRVCVGRDGRVSSPALEAALIEGLCQAGIEVWQVGVGPTPMLYFSVFDGGADAGIMVTGSHNPAHHNGFKMALGPPLGAAPFFGKDIKAMAALSATGDLEVGAGSVAARPAFEAYVARLLEEFTVSAAPTVVWDSGNGATGEVVEALASRLPGRHIGLFTEIDGAFPNHHPDPTVAANLVDLQAAVTAEGADLGIALDGDGDRIGVVDGEGEILWADQLLVLYARDLLRADPGATVIADVKASQVLFDAVAEAGGRPVMYKTGHSLIKAKMKELSAPLAGEMSGHIFFADRFYGFDDGLYAGIRLLRILAEQGTTLAEFRQSLPQPLNTPELRLECAEGQKAQVLAAARDRALAQPDVRVDETDGLRVTADDGWWLLRASNTQSVLVARIEAQDRDALIRMREFLADLLAEHGLTLPEN